MVRNNRAEKNRKQRLILILCEDKKSFPNYIKQTCQEKGYKKLISKKAGYKIEISHLKSADPMGILNKAQKLADKYYKIYCVFDYDGNTKGRINNYQQAMSLSVAANIVKINIDQ